MFQRIRGFFGRAAEAVQDAARSIVGTVTQTARSVLESGVLDFIPPARRAHQDAIERDRLKGELREARERLSEILEDTRRDYAVRQSEVRRAEAAQQAAAARRLEANRDALRISNDVGFSDERIAHDLGGDISADTREIARKDRDLGRLLERMDEIEKRLENVKPHQHTKRASAERDLADLRGRHATISAERDALQIRVDEARREQAQLAQTRQELQRSMSAAQRRLDQAQSRENEATIIRDNAARAAELQRRAVERVSDIIKDQQADITGALASSDPEFVRRVTDETLERTTDAQLVADGVATSIRQEQDRLQQALRESAAPSEHPGSEAGSAEAPLTSAEERLKAEGVLGEGPIPLDAVARHSFPTAEAAANWINDVSGRNPDGSPASVAQTPGGAAGATEYFVVWQTGPNSWTVYYVPSRAAMPRTPGAG